MKLRAMSVVLAMIAVALMAAMPAQAAPTVTSTTPDDDDTDVAINVVVKVHFSESMDTSEVEDATSISPVVSLSFSWDTNDDTMSVTAAFHNGVKYTITISNDATNATGTHMAHDYDFSFTTVSAPVLPTDPTYAWLQANWFMVLLLIFVLVILVVVYYRKK